VKLSKQTIIVLSSEPWGNNFLSKHHYAINLAKLGNNVFYINPPSNGKQIKDISKNLKVVDYGALRGINRLPLFLKRYFQKREARKILRLIDQKQVDIVWSFDPFRFQDLAVFNPKWKIYHPVDVHETSLEAEMNVDVIFSVADKILDRFTDNYLPKYFIDHGLASHFLNYSLNEVEGKIPFINEGLVVGYVGNIASDFIDRKILLELIDQNPDVNFCLVGPTGKSNLSTNANAQWFVDKLSTYKNVVMTGSVPSADLPKYIHQMDVCLNCYNTVGFRNFSYNTHKTMEYLSQGKIVISSFLDQYKERPDLVTMCESNDDLTKVFSDVKNNIDQYRSRQQIETRIAFAVSNLYSKQIEKIEDHLTDLEINLQSN
jgi:glycosyltransferase involved in cell wall biosynthesis